MTLSRRTLLAASATGSIAGLLGAGLFTTTASAMSRPFYGGKFRAHVPLGLATLDPHDPHSLASALLGPAIFETLYATTRSGQVYPTLATSMPQLRSGRVSVELRPGMKMSDGSSITARTVSESITRSQKKSPALNALGRPAFRASKPLDLSFGTASVSAVAQLLANPRSALVGEDFSPHRPVGCGALRVVRSGRTLILARNERAPRGGSFLDEVYLETAPVVDCLRAFEAKRSDVGFLGTGLHHPRTGVPKFHFADLGLVLVQPGRELSPAPSLGYVHEALARVPQAPLAALGLDRPRHSAQKWTSAKTSLLVSREDPWLVSIAHELASAWSSSDNEVQVLERFAGEVAERESNRRYGLYLRPLSRAGLDASSITQMLFQLDGTRAPRGGRALSPLEAGRQLKLGVAGTLNPRGALAPEFSELVEANHFSFDRAERRS